MADWETLGIDVKGAFLYGWLPDGEKIHMNIPKGFEKI